MNARTARLIRHFAQSEARQGSRMSVRDLKRYWNSIPRQNRGWVRGIWSSTLVTRQPKEILIQSV